MNYGNRHRFWIWTMRILVMSVTRIRVVRFAWDYEKWSGVNNEIKLKLNVNTKFVVTQIYFYFNCCTKMRNAIKICPIRLIQKHLVELHLIWTSIETDEWSHCFREVLTKFLVLELNCIRNENGSWHRDHNHHSTCRIGVEWFFHRDNPNNFRPCNSHRSCLTDSWVNKSHVLMMFNVHLLWGCGS